MAIGLAEALGQKGDLRLPTRSVTPTYSPYKKARQQAEAKEEQNALAQRQKLATKLLSFNDPVLPGDREKRQEMFSELVTEMNNRAAMDPNWRPSDAEFSTKLSEVLAENKKMEDMYKQVQQDIQFAAKNKDKLLLDEGEINLYDLTQDPLNNQIQYDEKKFQEARSKYAQGSKWWDNNYMATNPWPEAIGPGKSFDVKTDDKTYTKDGYNLKLEGYIPENDPQGVKFKKQLYEWIETENNDAKSLYQQAMADLVEADASFDRKNEDAIKQRAFDIVYPYYKEKFPPTTSKIKRGSGYSGGGGRGGAATGGFYEFGTSLTKNPFDPTGKSEVQPIGFSGRPTKTVNLKDKSGVERGEVEIQTVYVDKNNNVVGYEGQYRGSRGKTKTGYFPADKNPVDAPSVLPNLKTEYKAMYGKDLNTESITKPMEGKGKTGSTNRFVPDFLNDAIKNIGDFLRPRAPEPPQPGGPDVEGMV
jgi:hypothetical protein